ncbi:carbamoyltransferase [Kitasatospora sp. NPDC059599]|uniref:carbamoyltransferase family protein n=1 Tax=Kitasatospora sp. NPDC059599 TaxID=3346880 RepID=UPI0036806A97
MRVLGYSGLNGGLEFKREAFPGLDPRLHRFAQGYDSAAALVIDGEVVAAAAEERFTGEKTTGSFPVNAIEFCLAQAGLGPDDIDVLAHGFAYGDPAGSFGSPYSSARFREVYSTESQLALAEKFLPGRPWADRFRPVPHHLAHAASTFYPSGFEDSLIVVSDGMGESESLTVAVGRGESIEVLHTIPAMHSVGILYSLVTHHLGFVPFMDEYKVMGLAPYGDPQRYYDRFATMVRLREDGTYTVPVLARDRTAFEHETHEGVLRELAAVLGPARLPGQPSTQDHADIAAALQAITEQAMLHVLRAARERTGLNRLCLAGGVALNCTLNGLVSRSRLFDDIFVQPASSDDGTAIGAALAADAAASSRAGRMSMPYWGPGFSDEELAAAVGEPQGCTVHEYATDAELAEGVSELLADGNITAWVQGRMEFGPRALGNRSIIADPRTEAMRDRLNEVVKERESFRPFAPVVRVQDAGDYFEIEPGTESRYAHMLFVTQTRAEQRDNLGAVTHVDGSARVQVLHPESNPRFFELISAFGRRTGTPVVLNTSFNLRGQPIIATPQEALRTFLRSKLDALVLGRTVIVKDAGAAKDAATAKDAEGGKVGKDGKESIADVG